MSSLLKSLSEEGKEIVRMYIEDGKEYERKELVAVIKEKTERKSEMTDGVIAGVIKMLTSSNEIMVVSRGRYRKGVPVTVQTMQSKVLNLFSRFKTDLDKVCMVNVLGLDSEDMEFIERLKEISNQLESDIWTLEELGTEDKPKAVMKSDKAPKKQVEQVK